MPIRSSKPFRLWIDKMAWFRMEYASYINCIDQEKGPNTSVPPPFQLPVRHFLRDHVWESISGNAISTTCCWHALCIKREVISWTNLLYHQQGPLAVIIAHYHKISRFRESISEIDFSVIAPRYPGLNELRDTGCTCRSGLWVPKR